MGHVADKATPAIPDFTEKEASAVAELGVRAASVDVDVEEKAVHRTAVEGAFSGSSRSLHVYNHRPTSFNAPAPAAREANH